MYLVLVTKYAVLEILFFGTTWTSMFIAILIASYFAYSTTVLFIVIGESALSFTMMYILIVGSGRSIDPVCASHEGFCNADDLIRASQYSIKVGKCLEKDFLFMESGFGKAARSEYLSSKTSQTLTGRRRVSNKEGHQSHQLPTLDELLIGPKGLLINNIDVTHQSTITEVDAKYMYDCLKKAGCGSSNQLYLYLNDYYETDDQRINSLRSMDIPTFHAFELIHFLRSVYLGKSPFLGGVEV